MDRALPQGGEDSVSRTRRHEQEKSPRGEKDAESKRRRQELEKTPRGGEDAESRRRRQERQKKLRGGDAPSDLLMWQRKKWLHNRMGRMEPMSPSGPRISFSVLTNHLKLYRL